MEISLFERQYKLLCSKIMAVGENKENRTKVVARSLFSENIKIDLAKGFPILTGKKIFFEKALAEFNWFISGQTTTKYLKQHDIHWWDKFADEKGNLGKTYGYQLRNYNGEFDQLQYVLNGLKLQPSSRRYHITLWNPSEINEVKLPVCYTDFTFVHTNGFLDMHMNFRSSDVFLGLPYDICLAALFLHYVADFCDLIPSTISLTLNDAHIYENHFEPLKQYFKQDTYNIPKLSEDKKTLINYKSSKYIKAELNG